VKPNESLIEYKIISARPLLALVWKVLEMLNFYYSINALVEISVQVGTVVPISNKYV